MAEIRLSEGNFPTADNLKLFWVSATPAQPKAHIAVVHGYGEHIGRYSHVFDHFAEQGYAVHGFDVRGHGKSEGRRGHVRHFNDYLDDLRRFLDRVHIAAEGKPVFLLGHSHGGLLAASHALSQPTDLAGMVLSSPFFGLAFKPPALKLFAGRLIGKVYPGLHIGNELASADLTRDPEMVARHQADPLVIKVTTPGWFNEASAAQTRLLAEAGKVTLPLAMFVAGSDKIADAKLSEQFIERVGSKDKSFKLYPESFHEIMNDPDRSQVLAEITAWIDKHLP